MGSMLKKIAVARFSRTLASLLENGVTMLPALEIVRNVTGNVVISGLIEKASNEVEKGQGLGLSLAADEVFPDLAVQMVQVGEQSGELESMLYKIADVYENEVQASIMSMMAMLEPVMILVMAVVVLFIVLSICLPIFEMNQLVGAYPTTEQGLQALVEQPSSGNLPKNWRKGGYLEKSKVPKDPWGNEFIYLSPGIHDDFDLIAYGADGVAGGEDDDADINSWESE
jgi:type II secretion system protein G